jgi:ABC-2
MSGMLCWMLFSEIFSRCIGIFTDNANIIKKMSFPKIVLPATVVLSSVINNLILFAAIAVVFAFLGHFAGANLIFLPIFSLVTVMLAVGFGLFFGVINVFMRDVGQIIAIVLQFLFWLTPIVYMTSILPSNLQELIYINPLVGVVSGYHDILIYDKMPDFSLLIYPIIIGAASLGAAFFVYKRAEEEMADVL